MIEAGGQQNKLGLYFGKPRRNMRTASGPYPFGRGWELASNPLFSQNPCDPCTDTRCHCEMALPRTASSRRCRRWSATPRLRASGCTARSWMYITRASRMGIVGTFDVLRSSPSSVIRGNAMRYPTIASPRQAPNDELGLAAIFARKLSASSRKSAAYAVF